MFVFQIKILFWGVPSIYRSTHSNNLLLNSLSSSVPSLYGPVLNRNISRTFCRFIEFTGFITYIRPCLYLKQVTGQSLGVQDTQLISVSNMKEGSNPYFARCGRPLTIPRVLFDFLVKLLRASAIGLTK